MNLVTVIFSNVTITMKAQSVLRANGFIGEVRKTAKAVTSGCSYSLKLKGNLETIEGILKENNIEYLLITNN